MSDHLSNLPRENRDRSTSTSDHLSLLDVAVDFGHSAIYSGIQAPVTGFTQLIDKGLGTDLAGATALISAPRDSKFGTLDWHAQQVGGAIGMVLPFLAIHKVVGAAAGDSAFFSRPVATATSSGFLYGTVFQPSDSQGNFLGSRIKHGLVGGITFGTLAGVGQRLHNIAESGVVGNSLAKGVLENRAFSGVVSGAVAGTVGAQADALVSGKGIASGQDLFKSAYGYGMVGGLFGAMSGFDYKKATEPVNDTKTQPLTPADPQVKDTHTHPIEPTIVPQAHPDGVEVVLGAGGMRGFGLLGFLRYLEDKHVKIGTETGVSIGSIVAALHTNGYSSRRIEEIMKHELNQSSLKGLSGPSNPLRHPWQAIASHFVNMRTAMEGLVSKYQLEPNENLRIVAYNLATRSPVVFEGKNYNLAQALAASSAIPGAMRPIWYKPPKSGDVPESMSRRGILVDGGMYRMHPSEFSDGHALIAKISSPRPPVSFRTAALREWPKLIQPAIFNAFKARYIETPGPDDVIVPVGKQEVDSLAVHLPQNEINGLIDHGYNQAQISLDQHIAGGKIPVIPEPVIPQEEPQAPPKTVRRFFDPRTWLHSAHTSS